MYKPAACLHFLLEALSGLKHAHARNICHRDLKPANLLLDDDQHVLAADWGMTTSLDGDVPLTLDGDVMGTPVFIAPEVWQQGAKSDVYTAASDIYSMGQTFLFLLGPSELNRADLDPRFKQLYDRMTAQDPLDRFKTVDEVLAHIHAHFFAKPPKVVISSAPQPNASASAAAPPVVQVATVVKEDAVGDELLLLLMGAIVIGGIALWVTSGKDDGGVGGKKGSGAK